MTLESLARTIAKARHGAEPGFMLQPWQLSMLRQIDEYYARASAAGLTRDEANNALAARMSMAHRSRRYSYADALRDSTRTLLALPDGAQE